MKTVAWFAYFALAGAAVATLATHGHWGYAVVLAFCAGVGMAIAFDERADR